MKSKFLIYTSVIISSTFFNCSNAPRYYKSENTNVNRPSKKVSKSGKEKKFKGHRKIIKGISSFYAEDFHGKLTANGEVYDMYGLSAAHKTLPLNTIVRVTNLSNGKSQILRINDRGPYIDGRILDCSYGAAKKLDFLTEGTTEVEIVVMEWGDNKYMHHK